MVTTNEIRRPNKRDRKLAQESYTSLISSLEQLKSDQMEIEIEETGERIILPVKALNLLGEIITVRRNFTIMKVDQRALPPEH